MILPDNYQYQYAARSYRLIDGDTISLDLTLGFDVYLTLACRIIGIDAPEHTTLAGQLVTKVVAKWLAAAGALLVVSVARDKYAGRFDGVVWNHDKSQDWGSYLLAQGLARPYDGGAKPPWGAAQLADIAKKAQAILGT